MTPNLLSRSLRKPIIPAAMALMAMHCTMQKSETVNPGVTPTVTPTVHTHTTTETNQSEHEEPVEAQVVRDQKQDQNRNEGRVGDLAPLKSKPSSQSLSVANPSAMNSAYPRRKGEAALHSVEAKRHLAKEMAPASALAGRAMEFDSRHCYPPAPAPMPMHEAPVDDESYASIRENGFQSVVQNPLSTFSIDVDQAAYANVRRFLNQGQLPPADAVRIEELINYFPYPYAAPKGEHPFSITLDMGKTPWNHKTHLVLIGLKARDLAKAQLPPQNLTFLIDVSGSMHDERKLPLLKKAFGLLVDQMRPQDKVSLAVYAGAAGVVLPPTSGADKESIRSALDNLSAGGSTAGGAGLRLAYQLARESFSKTANNRVILATDGDFNVGESSDDAMERLITKERESGIFLSVLGFGMGNYKDSKMERLADKGNGNYAYIDNLLEARKVLVEQMGGTLQTLAKDVKLQVEWNPARVSAYRLIGYENRLLRDEDFNDDTKDAGEIGAGHTVTALYEIIPTGGEGGNEQVTPLVDPLKYAAKEKRAPEVKPMPTEHQNEVLTVKFRYKAPDAKVSRMFSEVLEASNTRSLAEASENLRFASAIAGFGMLLRRSEHRGDLTYAQVVSLAQGAKTFDPEGYRAECIRLIGLAQSLDLEAHGVHASQMRRDD